MNVIKLPAPKISGHITARKWREGAEHEAEVREFNNLITDAILESRLGDHATVVSIREAMEYCRVGTDNTPPTPSDTALWSQIAATNTLSVPHYAYTAQDSTGRGYTGIVGTYRFAAGAAAGTLEEVGFGSSAAADILMSRALILDAPDGTPTPLDVSIEDVLDVVYEVRIYTPSDPSDVVLELVYIDGDSYDITLRPIGGGSLAALTTAIATADATSFTTKEIRHLSLLGLGNNWIGGFEAAEVMPAVEDPWELGALSAVIDANTVLAAYVPGSKERSIDVTIPAGELNLAGGLSYLRLSTSEGSWGLGFDHPLPKVAGKTLTFTVLVQALQRYTF